MGAAATVLAGASASQDQHLCATEEAFQPIVIQSDPKAIADQARERCRRCAGERTTAACHRDEFFLEIVSAPHWQGIEPHPLDLERLAPASVGASDHLIDEAAKRIEVSKVAAATQQQRLLQGHLEMCVRPLDRAVLM